MLIIDGNTRDIEASVDIDSCLRARNPNDNRWDYAFGYKHRIYYIEVHHVNDKGVGEVVKKLKWLRDWQNRQTNSILLKANSSYHWISSGTGHLSQYSRFTRLLVQAGLAYPQKFLRIKDS